MCVMLSPTNATRSPSAKGVKAGCAASEKASRGRIPTARTAGLRRFMGVFLMIFYSRQDRGLFRYCLSRKNFSNSDGLNGTTLENAPAASNELVEITVQFASGS